MTESINYRRLNIDDLERERNEAKDMFSKHVHINGTLKEVMYYKEYYYTIFRYLNTIIDNLIKWPKAEAEGKGFGLDRSIIHNIETTQNKLRIFKMRNPPPEVDALALAIPGTTYPVPDLEHPPLAGLTHFETGEEEHDGERPNWPWGDRAGGRRRRKQRQTKRKMRKTRKRLSRRRKTNI